MNKIAFQTAEIPSGGNLIPMTPKEEQPPPVRSDDVEKPVAANTEKPMMVEIGGGGPNMADTKGRQS